MRKLKGYMDKKIKSISNELKDLKKNIKKVTATKLFWCESLIIVAILIFIIANFIVNFILGMYILSLLLFIIGVFTWKYI